MGKTLGSTKHGHKYRGFKISRNIRISKPLKKEIKKELKTALKKTTEVKFVELNTFISYVVPNAHVYDALTSRFTNYPVQGITDNFRIGDEINLLNLDLQLTLAGVGVPVGIISLPSYLCRVIIGVMKNPAGTGMPSGSVYPGSPNATGILDCTVAYAINAPYYKQFREEWVCVSDKTYSLSTQMGYGVGNQMTGNNEFIKHLHTNVKLNKKMKFLSNVNADSSISNNLPFILICSNVPATITTGPYLTLYSRLNYTD